MRYTGNENMNAVEGKERLSRAGLTVKRREMLHEDETNNTHRQWEPSEEGTDVNVCRSDCTRVKLNFS